MDKLVGLFSSVGRIELRQDQDAVDRFNYRYTVVILSIFTLIVTTSHYVGDPITCWTPAHFTGQMVHYTDDWCWIKGTYYHPMKEHIPRVGEPREFDVNYYQWIPLFLMVQALLFYSPSVVWHTFNSRTGIDINKVITAASTLGEVVLEKRETTLKHLVRYIDNYLDKHRDRTAEASRIVRLQRFLAEKCCMICVGKRTGSFIWVLYMLVKILYIGNVIGQLLAINSFIGMKHHLYGLGIFLNLASGKDWEESPVFPRITLCSFYMRTLGGNNHRHTLQCVLPVNLFNEKIYIFLWFWYIFVLILTSLNFFSWIFKSIHGVRTKFFKKNLVWMERLSARGNTMADKKLYHKFVDKYLCADGYLIMRLVALNTSEFVMSEIIAALWDNFKKRQPASYEHGLLENGGYNDFKKSSEKDELKDI
ncbi:unnamed protein product [Owenia fusiformis]|uniref:Innexin n=1 Tax=Owenia fusiformis TaxID=6347 RepID=A0A8J1T5C7_OWEFU|nr:unnamed protein product [Owenia fusiformis]